MNSDRFQFLREKFNIVPIYFYIYENKHDIEEILRRKKITHSCDSYFMEMYKDFLTDSLEDVLLEEC